MRTRVLLVDDHVMMRDGLRVVLERDAEIEVVGEAGDGRTALRLASKLSPDVVVMDVGLPDLNGIEATRALTSARPGIKVIALSMHSDRRYVLEMLNAGAAAYVLKNSAASDLIGAIHAVRAGGSFLSPNVSATLIQHVREATAGRAPAGGASASPLSPREREVVQLIAEGKTSKEAAAALGISAKTVDTHRREIMRKLDLHSVAALTKYALRAGLTSLET